MFSTKTKVSKYGIKEENFVSTSYIIHLNEERSHVERMSILV